MKLHAAFHVFAATLAVAICLSYTQFVAADVQKTLHVSPGGSDDNPGTKEKPLKTIQRARDEVRKINREMTGDIEIVLHGGTYRLGETLVFDHHDGGSGGHKVIYKAAQGETPVVSGGKQITGWKADAQGRWKATSDIDNFRQLYVDGRRAVRARGAAPAGMALHGADGYKTSDAKVADWKNPGDIEFCYIVVWAHTRCKVQDIRREGDNAVITMLQPHFTHAREKEGVHVELPNYIENAFELLDEPGEWYLDRAGDTVYYIPKPGQDMSKSKVVAPVVEKLVELRGTLDEPVENMEFAGITFAEGGWLRPSRIGLIDVQANFVIDWKRPMKRSGGYTVVHNEHVKSPANVVCRTAKNVRFERCTFTRLGSAGIDMEFGSQNNVVSGCSFKDISGTAVQIGDLTRNDHHPDDPRMIVKGNAVTNNHIHDCCVEYMGGVGVFLGYTDGTTVAHNQIHDLPYSGMSIGWGWGEEDAGGGAANYYMPYKYATPTPSGNNRIVNNHIYRVMLKLHDGGGIYTLGNMAGTVIRGNYVHDVNGGCIYLDEGSGFIEVAENCAYNHKGMWFNNKNQNRKATCNVHDNSINMPPPGNATRCPGKFGKGLLCDGKVTYESVPHADKLEPKHLTVEAWINIKEYPGGEDPRRWIVNKNTHEFSEGHYALVIDGKKVAGFMNIGDGQENYHEAYSDEILQLDRWHHLAMSYDGSVMNVYVDGRKVAAKKIGKARVPGQTSLDIGRRQDDYNKFAGKIDEVRLYDRALSPQEIEQNAAATDPKSAVAEGLVGHWDFDTAIPIKPEIQAIIDKAGFEAGYRGIR